jgi:hypothetical protein
MADGSS